jgi:hypothetical protein
MSKPVIARNKRKTAGSRIFFKCIKANGFSGECLDERLEGCDNVALKIAFYFGGDVFRVDLKGIEVVLQ